MRTVTDAALWDALWHSNKCHPEIIITSYDPAYPGVARYIFGQDRIISCDTYSSLYPNEDIGIGGTVASRLSCTLYIKDLNQASVLPYRAILDISIRLTNGDLTSNWLTKGRYFIDTREEDKNAGTITITAYDGMINAEATYAGGVDIGVRSWLVSCCTTMNWRSTYIPASIDDNDLTIPASYTQYTYREILGFIAAHYGGNFFLGEDNALKFVDVGEVSPPAAPNVDTYTGYFDIQDTSINSITAITIYAENGYSYPKRYTQQEGKAIEVKIPWGDDALAVNLLNHLRYHDHVPYTARSARVDPRTELGDVLNITPVIDGVVQSPYPVLIATIARHFNDLMLSDISVPGGEGEHECSVKGSKYRSENRQMEYVRQNYAGKSNNTPGVLLEPSTTIGDVLITEDNGLGGRVAVWGVPQSGGMPPPPSTPPGPGESRTLKAYEDPDLGTWVVAWVQD